MSLWGVAWRLHSVPIRMVSTWRLWNGQAVRSFLSSNPPDGRFIFAAFTCGLSLLAFRRMD